MTTNVNQNMMYKQVECAQKKWPDKIHLVRFKNLCTNYDVELERIKMFIPGVLNNIDTQNFFSEESQKNIG